MDTNPRHWVSALRASHDNLVALVKNLDDTQLKSPSYCREWDVSQVVSHLGSGAEIALKSLERALDQAEPLGREDFMPIWDRWNAMEPERRASELVVWDRRSVSVLQALDDETMATLRLAFFTLDLDAVGIIGLRLGEHALHLWDLQSSFDPQAEVMTSSAELLLDRLEFVVSRTAKAEAASGPKRVAVHTLGPERRFTLSIDDKVALTDEDADGGATTEMTGTLELPAPALLRLVYGRLDAAHTPAGVHTEGAADLDELRRVFPGF